MKFIELITAWGQKLIKLIAAWGQNIQFVAFWAHFGVAALVTEHSHHRLIVAAIIIAGAAIKEFYFDAKYEKDPPQTFKDNFQDFIGWGAGALAGVFL
jgi:hypothetical protein